MEMWVIFWEAMVPGVCVRNMTTLLAHLYQNTDAREIKCRPSFSPFKSFTTSSNLDVLLTKHSLQLLFPDPRLRDPKLGYILLMRPS